MSDAAEAHKEAGNVAFKDRKEFAAASRELDRLLRAIKAADRCEHCAVALMQDSTCPRPGQRTSESVPRANKASSTVCHRCWVCLARSRKTLCRQRIIVIRF